MQKVGCDESWVNWPQSLICKQFLWIDKERMMNWLPKIIHRKQNFKNLYAIIEYSSSLAIRGEHYIVKFCIVRAEVQTGWNTKLSLIYAARRSSHWPIDLYWESKIIQISLPFLNYCQLILTILWPNST